jgi:hypothetical protein
MKAAGLLHPAAIDALIRRDLGSASLLRILMHEGH